MCDLATLDPATPDEAPVLADLLELYQFELDGGRMLQVLRAAAGATGAIPAGAISVTPQASVEETI